MMQIATQRLMTEQHERLIQAREAAGFESATAAAEAMGVRVPTYTHHENGTRGLSRAAERYAKFFRVSAEWLLYGRGAMKLPNGPSTVGMAMCLDADASVHLTGAIGGPCEVEKVEIPHPDRLSAVRVRGNSQYPRYLDGEVLLIDKEPISPKAALNRYAIVEVQDGRLLLKIVRRGSREGLFRIDSHNAPSEDDVRIEKAFVVRGCLT